MLYHDFVAVALRSDQMTTWRIRVPIGAANWPIFRLVTLSAFGSALRNLHEQLRKWISLANLTRNWAIWWRTKGRVSPLSEGVNRAWMKTINDRMRRQLTSALYVSMKSSEVCCWLALSVNGIFIAISPPCDVSRLSRRAPVEIMISKWIFSLFLCVFAIWNIQIIPLACSVDFG